VNASKHEPLEWVQARPVRVSAWLFFTVAFGCNQRTRAFEQRDKLVARPHLRR
jgi:hypothetical protein